MENKRQKLFEGKVGPKPRTVDTSQMNDFGDEESDSDAEENDSVAEAAAKF